MTAREKLEILQKVLKEGASVTSLCRQNKISRKTFYSWKKRYIAAKTKGKSSCLRSRRPKGLQHPRGTKDLFKHEVLKMVAAHPELGSRKISKILLARGKKLGNHGVYTLLKTLGLEREEKRKEFNSLHRTLRQARDRFAPGPRRLLNQSRKQMAEEVLLAGERVNKVAEKFKVSRKTVWKWVCRYREAQTKQLELLPALLDQHPIAALHPRGTPLRLEKKILGMVTVHPEYSCHRLTREIKEIGHHGIQNILFRNDLNTYQKRLVFAKAQAPVTVVQPITAWLNCLKTVWETFIPQVAPAPPPSLGKLVRSLVPPFTFSFLFGFLLFLWVKMLAGQPLSSQIGLTFASISLTFGFFFFLYSLKYYFTLVLILGFSRQVSGGQELGIRNGKGKGILQRLFGMNGHGNGIRGENGNGNGGGSFWQRVFGGGGNGNGNGGGRGYGGGLQPDLSRVKLERHPFVSIHLPLYNEKRVVERLLTACTSMEYENYEVVVVDDSTDETTTIVEQFARQWNLKTEGLSNKNPKPSTLSPRPYLKVIHRESREGYKGGALREALKVSDPCTEFVIVFDADFLPYPDTLTQFLKYFQVTAGGLDFRKASSRIAAVQGYQWHVLNKSENWITRGVRSEYAGSYVIERSGEEALGALKQIAGSVYIIRKDILTHYGWGTSITEDFELTLKLYRDGFKVVYTPYIQTPSECVSTLKRLVRQRMRWAEGHSHNIKRMFTQLMWGRWEEESSKFKVQSSKLELKNLNLDSGRGAAPWVGDLAEVGPPKGKNRIWIPSKLTWMEKLEFLYLSPYYLQATFFLVGTLSWFLSEAIFQTRLPFWTSIWGWSLVFTNLLSLPLMNTVGLFLEESEERDYGGILSFILLTYLVVPFQAYAAVKGFLESQEGPWFRTPKTGIITDVLTRGRFYRWLTGIFPGSRPATGGVVSSRLIPAPTLNPYLALTTANSRFDEFRIRPRRLRWVGRTVISMVMIFAILLNTVSFTQNSHFASSVNPDQITLNDKKEFQINGKDTFSLTETPQFHLKIPNNQPKKTSFLKKLFNSEVQAAEPEVKTSLFDSSGVLVEGVNTKVSKEESGYKLSFADNVGLRAGKYTLKASLNTEDGKTYESSQDFRWGVLAINTNKSIYTQGEVVKFGFGVLDDRGATICNAQLLLDITTPSGEKVTLSNQNGLIKQNERCTHKGRTEGPDYWGEYRVDKLGSYRFHLVADTQNGQRSIDDAVEVKQDTDIPFDIERTSFPTRIYPPMPYPVVITIKANQDFTGTVSDQVPASFEISQSDDPQILQMTDTATQGVKKLISWNMNLKKGETYQLGYTIKFPRVSPEFYLIGPLKLASSDNRLAFSEARSWQIAGDVVATVFMETPDATNYTTGDTGTQFWTAVSGSFTYDTTQKKSGRGSWKVDSGAGGAAVYVTKNNILADAGRRISFYIYINALPTSTVPLLRINDTAVYDVRITSGGVLQLWNNTAQIGSNGSTLSTGTWYRLSLAYTITSSSVNEARLFLNGNSDISVSNATLATGGSNLIIGWIYAPGANKVLYVEDIYVDDSTALTDTGDIRITYKAPGTVNNNSFDTTGGTGAVNERPISETNYKQHAAATDVAQDYTLQAASAGDVDMSGNTIVAYSGFVWAKLGSSAITVTTKGTAQDKGTTATLDLTATFTAGSSIIAGTAEEGWSGIGITSIYLQDSSNNNLVQLLEDATVEIADNVRTKVFSTHNLSSANASASHHVRVNKTTNEIAVIAVIQATGLAASSVLDKSATSTGTSASPDAGDTATLSQAEELVVGVIGTEGPDGDAAGTWTTATNHADENNQRLGTTGAGATGNNTVAMATKITSSTTAAGAAKTSITSRDWAALVATYQSASSPDIILNGTAYAISLTTTSAMYEKIIDSTSYPSNAAGIGMRSTASDTDTYFYEGGVQIAFVGEPIPEFALALAPLAAFLPKIIKYLEKGKLTEDLLKAIRRIFKIIKNLLLKPVSLSQKLFSKRKRKKEKWKDEENL